MNSNSDKKCLEDFIHHNSDLGKLEDIADEFNIFSALKIVNTEIRHSNFLSWLMDPNESHGLGDTFLLSFLKEVSYNAPSHEIEGPSIFDVDNWHFDDAEVLRETKNIDILIKSDSEKFVCVIENKIHSKEHSNQLQRYKEIIINEYPDYSKFFIYLTTEGDSPSDSDYIPIHYSEIVPLLEHLIKTQKDKLSSDILSFISQYKDMLRRYFMENPEIQKICRKIYKRHKKALDLIFEFKADKSLEIYEYLLEVIRKDSDLTPDDSSKSYVRFIPNDMDVIPKKGDGWTKTKRILLFEFNNHSKGVDLILMLGPGQDYVREKLYTVFKRNTKLFNKAKRDLTKKWFTAYKKNILKLKDFEDMDIEEIKEIIDKKIVEFKSSVLPKIAIEIKQISLENTTNSPFPPPREGRDRRH